MTHGPIMRSMLIFAAPMVLGNLLQQCYNIADTLIVGKFLGSDALAAVGSSFTLMTFLVKAEETAIIAEGGALSAHIGHFLLWNRRSFSVVWILSGAWQTVYVGGAYCIFSRNTSNVGLSAFLYSRCRCCRNMVVGSHWLAFGRYSRHRLLYSKEKAPVSLSREQNFGAAR